MSEKSSAKDTFFCKKKTLNCHGKILTLQAPMVMGILNITPDSFYDGGSYNKERKWIEQVDKMLEEGADIIDIGAASTRPGADVVSEETEKDRLLPVLQSIRKKWPDTLLSIDTSRSKIARICIDEGASMINDISGGTFDDAMIPFIAHTKAPYIIMHIQGNPRNMQQNPSYENIMNELIIFFSKQVEKLKQAGVYDVIIDPGFGFGKTLKNNYELMHHLERFHIFELPLMVGFSRKSMINKVLGTTSDQALNGTTVLNTIALLKGADILRVHDVKEAVEAVRLVENLSSI